MASSWFEEILTTEERAEVEAAVEEINTTLNRIAMVCGACTEFIDARMPDARPQLDT